MSTWKEVSFQSYAPLDFAATDIEQYKLILIAFNIKTAPIARNLNLHKQAVGWKKKCSEYFCDFTSKINYVLPQESTASFIDWNGLYRIFASSCKLFGDW